eukprot:723042-Rhodomonas_salina.1
MVTSRGTGHADMVTGMWSRATRTVTGAVTGQDKEVTGVTWRRCSVAPSTWRDWSVSSILRLRQRGRCHDIDMGFDMRLLEDVGRLWLVLALDFEV